MVLKEDVSRVKVELDGSGFGGREAWYGREPWSFGLDFDRSICRSLASIIAILSSILNKDEETESGQGSAHPSCLLPIPLLIMLSVVGRPDSVITFRFREEGPRPGSMGAC